MAEQVKGYVHNFTFDSRLYRFQQKGQNCLQLIFEFQNIGMAEQKCCNTQSKREGSIVPEVCVSQNRRKYVLQYPPYDCVYTFNFSLQCKLKFSCNKVLAA